MDWKSLVTVASFAVILSAGVTIAAHYLHPPGRTLIYLFKPLTTILILAVALLPGTFLTDWYAGAIGLGLLFSLSGDVWLMLPGNRFLHGLISFLFAHLCYIYAFLTGAPANGFLLPAIFLALIGAILLAYLWPVLSRSLKPAVSLYVAVIVTMATLAVGRSLVRAYPDTVSAAIGALLFMASDAVLAIDRFRRPFRLAQAVVLATYFAGQLMIALSIGLLAFRTA